jgi:hypothetical protein
MHGSILVSLSDIQSFKTPFVEEGTREYIVVGSPPIFMLIYYTSFARFLKKLANLHA